jgi:hypothetical protein
VTAAGAIHPPLWLCRPLGLGLALMTAKTIMIAGRDDLPLADPLALPALMHDHLMVVSLFLMLDLFSQLRSRRGGPSVEAVANRAMWFMLALALLWVGASVPVAAVLGAPASLAEIRQQGGILAVLEAGATPASVLGALVAMGIGLASPRLLHRAPRRRVVSVAVMLGILIAVAGPIGRQRLALGGLERDPFAVIIQATWQGFQAVAGP